MVLKLKMCNLHEDHIFLISLRLKCLLLLGDEFQRSFFLIQIFGVGFDLKEEEKK